MNCGNSRPTRPYDNASALMTNPRVRAPQNICTPLPGFGASITKATSRIADLPEHLFCKIPFKRGAKDFVTCHPGHGVSRLCRILRLIGLQNPIALMMHPALLNQQS
jgi:hypothetical protein